MNKDNYNVIKIATLNLNGEIFWSINKKPRLPEDLFNIENIKSELINKIMKGLEGLLKDRNFDIIAIQELIYISRYRKQIEDIIIKNDYKLMLPDNLGHNIHFTVGFIIKNKDEEVQIIKKANYKKAGLSTNKNILLECKMNNVNFKILNVHITQYSRDTNYLKNFLNNEQEGTINMLLGDMNAYTNKQIEHGGIDSTNAHFIKDLINHDCRKNDWFNDNLYTFFLVIGKN